MRKNEISDAEWELAQKLFDLYWFGERTLKSLAAEYGYKESALRYRLQHMRTKYIVEQRTR